MSPTVVTIDWWDVRWPGNPSCSLLPSPPPPPLPLQLPSGYLGPGGLAEGGKYKLCTGGAAAKIDNWILGQNHIYQYPTARVSSGETLGLLPSLLCSLSLPLSLSSPSLPFSPSSPSFPLSSSPSLSLLPLSSPVSSSPFLLFSPYSPSRIRTCITQVPMTQRGYWGLSPPLSSASLECNVGVSSPAMIPTWRGLDDSCSGESFWLANLTITSLLHHHYQCH